MNEMLDAKLEKAKRDVTEMGLHSRGMLSDAVRSFCERDTMLADNVYARRKQLSEMDFGIEKRLLRILSLYQPVACDLRAIMCMYQMSNSFFRIGRNAKEIAKLANEMPEEPHLEIAESIGRMACEVDMMLESVISAFGSGDVSLLHDFSKRDDSIDTIYRRIYNESMMNITHDLSAAGRSMEYVLVSRFLERCGDHACLMAEKIIYMYTGEREEIT